ncbi:hypothetical protein [Streptomyces sp. SAJ15]|uniref:hypothetical protein n=1 Tax=Streptomyces sp. SAJ15 TaxID=2011095 RepID=UPI00135E3637|nr:hypothetical protein [Streptomyces sp. SAJ15]TVL87779.1 hypothetical protein CD790_32880 [Streptomyces sp. SAJ15]
MLHSYADYLREFKDEVEAQLAGGPDEGTLALQQITFREDTHGIWAEAIVTSLGAPEPLTRRRLVIPVDGPDKDGWLAGTIFASSLVEDFDKGKLIQ